MAIGLTRRAVLRGGGTPEGREARRRECVGGRDGVEARPAPSGRTRLSRRKCAEDAVRTDDATELVCPVGSATSATLPFRIAAATHVPVRRQRSGAYVFAFQSGS